MNRICHVIFITVALKNHIVSLTMPKVHNKYVKVSNKKLRNHFSVDFCELSDILTFSRLAIQYIYELIRKYVGENDKILLGT